LGEREFPLHGVDPSQCPSDGNVYCVVPVDISGGWSVSARNFAIPNNGNTTDDETCAVLSRAELERLADFIACKLVLHGEHSQGFMVHAVDEYGSEVVKVAIAAPRNEP
jgi:hypothetical protein